MHFNIRFLDSKGYDFYRYDNDTCSLHDSSFSELYEYILDHPECFVARNIMNPDSVEVYNYNSVYHCIEIVFYCCKVMEV